MAAPRFAVHDPEKIVLDLAVAIGPGGGDVACDVALLSECTRCYREAFRKNVNGGPIHAGVGERRRIGLKVPVIVRAMKFDREVKGRVVCRRQ